MFPEISTQRFVLKQILPEDQEFIFKGLSHPEVVPYYGVQYKTFESTKVQMDFYDRLWRERTGTWWKIMEKGNNTPVGACGINNYQFRHEKAEMGYWLIPEHWGRGIMKEVLPVMINHVFTHWKLHRLEAVIEEGNDSSMKLAERLGFQLEGVMRESEIKNGKRINLLMYSLLNTDKRNKLRIED